MTPPANFHATGGDISGSVDLGWDPQRGVQTHIAHYATAPTGRGHRVTWAGNRAKLTG